jgi:predicted GNAT family acetyltransferase
VETRVVDGRAALRFEVYAGERLAGWAAYARKGGVITFTHTEVDPAFEGRGLGSVLVRGALDAARAEGLEVVPVCPFVRSYVERHPEYADLVRAG